MKTINDMVNVIVMKVPKDMDNFKYQDKKEISL